MSSDEEKKNDNNRNQEIQHYQKKGNDTVVAEVITESIRFGPEIGVCNHKKLIRIPDGMCICNERVSADIPTSVSQWKSVLLAA